MEAGKLRHRVRVQVNRGVPDAAGEVQQAWVDFVPERWASITSLSGTAALIANQVNKDMLHEVSMRWFPGLTEEMRLVFKGRNLEIDSLNNVDERDIEWRMLAKEKK